MVAVQMEAELRDAEADALQAGEELKDMGPVAVKHTIGDYLRNSTAVIGVDDQNEETTVGSFAV